VGILGCFSSGKSARLEEIRAFIRAHKPGKYRLVDVRTLRAFLVTPDMHRVHHSVLPRETFSNFGFNLAWWDHLFGTYRAQPQEGHDGMAIGLPWFRDPGQVVLGWLLVLPFRKRTW
jgi:sterol desaturase/sphingolipid hydroxylase (fatty acid hydroxylase superfamily)